MRYFDSTKRLGCSQPNKRTVSGFSLLEILMCLSMLTLIMLPLTLVLGSGSQAARGAYLQSTRTILLNSLKNEAIPSSPNYVTTFTDGSDITTVSDSGQVIPYRRAVDNTTAGATTAMKRTTLFYIYNNSSDASSSPRYKATWVSYPKVLRMRLGCNTDVIDTLNRYWINDNAGQLLYSNANKVPGWVSSVYADSWNNDILNTVANDDQLFGCESIQGTINYALDVENGAYTVKFYCAEIYAPDSGTSRAMDFYLEGVQVNTDGPYSAYLSTGGANYGEVKMYDTTVTDGVLNITAQISSIASDPYASLKAIEIIKRTTN